MASIRNSISLQDHMSPVFRSIIKSMDTTLRAMKNLDRQANRGVQSRAFQAAQRDVKRANNELIRMQNNLSRADKAAGKLAQSTDRVATNSSKMSKGGMNLSNLASGLYLLKNIATALSNIMEIPDTMGAIQYRLETYDTSAASGNQLFDAAYAAAMESRSDLTSTANLASRILTSGATNGSGAEAIDLAQILNKASFLGGSSSEESKRALLQLSQGLASGTLQGDELRAIREQSPGLTDVLARGLSSLGEKGVLPEKFIGTTMGDLKQLGADGELTADRIVAAFKEMRGYVDETFESSPKQFGQAMTGIANVWKRWFKLMSQGDNAFAKINEKAWQLLDWLESDAGTQFFANLSAGLNLVVDAVVNTIDWFNELDNSTQILQSALTALGIVAVGVAIKWIASWIAAAWPVLLVIAIIGLLIYVLMSLGMTAGQVIGAIAGFIVWLAFLLYDAVILIITIIYAALAIIWDAIVAVVTFIIQLVIHLVLIILNVIQAILQAILWVITTIWAALVTIYDVLYTIVKGAWGIIKGVIVGIYGMFVWLANGVLGVLESIASVIDAIFGSDLADTIGGWMDGLDASVEVLNETLDPEGEFEDIGNQWDLSYSELGKMYAGEGEYDAMNITDNMQDLWGGGMDLIDTFGEGAMASMLDPTALDSWASGALVNPEDGWNMGYDWGENLGDSLAGLDFESGLADLSSMQDSMSDFEDNGMDVSVKSDVELSDQDIQLLRDIAARDFLLNLQTVTPVANVKFGDVRETADVNKIMEVIQDMVDEELATSLVVD